MALAVFAGYWSIRFAVADLDFRHNDVVSLRKAVELAPGNAAYRALLTEHLEGLGLNPDPQLNAAAALSPLDSHYWIRLGFRAEVEGDSLRDRARFETSAESKNIQLAHLGYLSRRISMPRHQVARYLAAHRGKEDDSNLLLNFKSAS